MLWNAALIVLQKKIMSNLKSQTENKILVLGSTGKTGSRVLQRLKLLGYSPREGSRSANPKFDWTDNTTWKPALQNINSVYISFQPDVAIPGTVETIRLFAQTAVENGVKKLVLLSGRGEVEAQQCEQAIINSGAEWTIVRASWFSQNFSEGFLLESIVAGHVSLPVGNVGEPFIDADDIADVAVAALIDEKHNSQIYELTGSRLLTFNNAIEEISNATGRQIQYEQISIEAYTAMLTEYQVPEEYIKLLTYLFTQVLDGRNAKLADGVQRALGRKPTDFSEYVKKVVASGLWTNNVAA